jgi:hypothetical protein
MTNPVTLKSYYIIWRGDEDFFYITRLDLEPWHYNKLSNNQLVQMCDDVENLEMPSRFVGGSPASYELIDVFTGENIEFVGRL